MLELRCAARAGHTTTSAVAGLSSGCLQRPPGGWVGGGGSLKTYDREGPGDPSATAVGRGDPAPSADALFAVWSSMAAGHAVGRVLAPSHPRLL